MIAPLAQETFPGSHPWGIPLFIGGLKSRAMQPFTAVPGRSPQDPEGRANHLAWALEVAWNVTCRPGPADLFALRFDTHVDYDKGGLNVYHSKVKRWAWIPCDNGFMRSVFLRQQVHGSGCLIEYKESPVLKVAKALRTAGKRAGLPLILPYLPTCEKIPPVRPSALSPNIRQFRVVVAATCGIRRQVPAACREDDVVAFDKSYA